MTNFMKQGARWLLEKYFMDVTEPRKIFSLRFISHKSIYETKFSFLCEVLTLYRQVL